MKKNILLVTMVLVMVLLGGLAGEITSQGMIASRKYATYCTRNYKWVTDEWNECDIIVDVKAKGFANYEYTVKAIVLPEDPINGEIEIVKVDNFDRSLAWLLSRDF